MSNSKLFAAILVLSSASHLAAAENAVRTPVLLELFTSEGCSSCPPADRLLAAFDQKQPVAGADLIVLSEHVDYWDRLGWKDPFSSPLYTARQQEYANRLHGGGAYTPQLVVDGRFGLVGSDDREAAAAIQKAMREPKLAIVLSRASRDESKVTLHIMTPADSASTGRQGVLYAALADNRAESHVARGENAGRSLAHVAVTRVLKQVGVIDLGAAADREVTLPVQPGMGTTGLRLVAFIQDSKTGHILGVAVQKL